VNQSRRFPAIPLSVAAARHFTTQALTDSPADATEAVELMVSELATNAIEHVMTSFFLTIHTTPQEIRIEVTDYGPGTPAIRHARADALRGRGLQIVDMLSTHWGVTQISDAAKTVWFTLALTTANSPTQGAKG
jgi:anti-sigma regulatory factor (Ser/Thr protein kinase)